MKNSLRFPKGRHAFETSSPGEPQGFTLVELLIALAISSMVILALVGVHRVHQDTYMLNMTKMETEAKLRAAISQITSELRTAGYDPTELASSGIVCASRDFIYFTRDLVSSNPPRLDGANEHVAFCLYHDTKLGIHRGSNGAGACSGTGSQATRCPGSGYHQALAEDISQLEFRYFGQDSQGEDVELPPDNPHGAVATPEDIRRIEVTVAAEFLHAGQARSRSFTESVYLRNMGL